MQNENKAKTILLTVITLGLYLVFRKKDKNLANTVPQTQNQSQTGQPGSSQPSTPNASQESVTPAAAIGIASSDYSGADQPGEAPQKPDKLPTDGVQPTPIPVTPPVVDQPEDLTSPPTAATSTITPGPTTANPASPETEQPIVSQPSSPINNPEDDPTDDQNISPSTPGNSGTPPQPSV